MLREYAHIRQAEAVKNKLSLRVCLLRMLVLTVCLIFETGYSLSYAADAIYTPRPGSYARKQILDVLRGSVEAELKTSVRFQIKAFYVQDGWVFLRGILLEPSGRRLNYQATPYQAFIDQGLFDDWFCALLQRDKQGRWHVIEYAIGATDVVFEAWARRYAVPAGIFQ